MKKILNPSEILKTIPHRYPFLLIDKVEIDTSGGIKSAKGIKCVSANELYFHGHFPDMPIMPGVLILEAMAQTTATLLYFYPELKNKKGFFAGIKNAKFRKQVFPGDVLEIYITIDKVKGSIAKVLGVAKVDGEISCEAELLFALQ
jgi:3-hydroxyacyl-[acyl-carrier-protein] dehydratase